MIRFTAKPDAYRQGTLWRKLMIAFLLVLFGAATLLQLLARRNDSVVQEQIIADPPLAQQVQMYAEAHWRSLLLGNRQAFLAGLSDQALLVLNDAEAGEPVARTETEEPGSAPQITFNGLTEIAEGLNGPLAPLLGVAARPEHVIALHYLREDARRPEAELRVTAPGPEEEQVELLRMRAAARLSEHGNIVEERLEILFLDATLR